VFYLSLRAQEIGDSSSWTSIQKDAASPMALGERLADILADSL
jgi:hypothetical protein